MTSLDIVIVNWNAGRQLFDCVSSISEACNASFELGRVAVVDNASTDGSLDRLDALTLPLHIFRNEDNQGFAAACNQGAGGSTSDYILFLNPDTRLFQDSLVVPLAFMEEAQNASVGICGVRLLDENGNTSTSCARFPTLRIIVGETLGLAGHGPFPRHFHTQDECKISREVDQIMGAFFLVRRTLFEELGGFDDRFFVYYEEVDFSKRARARGHTSYHIAEASAFHKGGGTSEQVRAHRIFYILRSRLLYGLKHFTRRDAATLVFVTVMVEFATRVVRALIRRSVPALMETLRAYRMLLEHLWTRKSIRS